MRKPNLPTVARAAAYAILLMLCGATLAVLILSIRMNADIRDQLQHADERLTLLSQRTDSGMAGLSKGLADLSQALRRDIGSVGRAARGDMSRMRDRLAGRLDEVAQQVNDLAAAVPESPGVQQTPPPGLPPPPVTSTALTSSPTPALAQTPSPVLAAASPAEEDLAAAREAGEGAALFASGKYDQARKAFSRILASRPDDSQARLYYAASLYRANPADTTRYVQIEKNLHAVLDADPRNVLALDTLSMLEVERGRWPDALAHLRQLLALQPENTRFLKTAGYCALKVGDPAAAHEDFHAAARLSPPDVEALTSLGDCEWVLGEAADAQESWKAALTLLDPGSPAGARASAELRVKLARTGFEEGGR